VLISDVHAPNFVNGQNSASLFAKGDKSVSGSGAEKCDGCYPHLDKNRSDIVRSSWTAAGFKTQQM
jgi:hypothetical protein